MEPSPQHDDRTTIVLAWGTAAFLLLVPLAVTPDLIDRFRIVKESLSRTHGILAALALLVALLFAGTERFREMLRERHLVIAIAAGAFWAIVTTLFSTHRVHSVDSLITFLTCMLIFAGAWYAAPRIPILVLDLLVPVVLVNTVLVTLQFYRVYMPFAPDEGTPNHIAATGLIGNPNIVGSYMTLMTMIFAGAATRTRGPRQLWLVFGTICAAAGVFVSQSRTAVIALIAGLLLLAVGRSRKRAVMTIVAILVLLAAGVALRMPAVVRLMALPRIVAKRGVTFAVSGRVLPLLTGVEMVRDHPLLGMGPGTFKYQYMTHAVPVIDRIDLPRGIVSLNYGEAHNDHLQLMVETGIPGYALFLVTVFLLVKTVRKSETHEPRGRVAMTIVVPLAGALLVLCLAQFPLYVPVTRHLLASMAGLILGWSRTT